MLNHHNMPLMSHCMSANYWFGLKASFFSSPFPNFSLLPINFTHNKSQPMRPSDPMIRRTVVLMDTMIQLLRFRNNSTFLRCLLSPIFSLS